MRIFLLLSVVLLTACTTLPQGADFAALDKINNEANSLFPETDAKIWGKQDFWATPTEAKSAGAGDCEEYAIDKYFKAKAAGIPHMKIGGFGALINGKWTGHAAALYCPDDCYVLDSNYQAIEKLSDRFDLRLEFTIDDNGLYKIQQGFLDQSWAEKQWQAMLIRKSAGKVTEPVWVWDKNHTKTLTR